MNPIKRFTHALKRTKRTAPAVALLMVACEVLNAADVKPLTPEAGSQAEKKTRTQWTITPDPSLPNVLILGDSISIGYTLQVRKLLQGKANVLRPGNGNNPVNCSGTTFGVEQIDQWLNGRQWAIIHFNWGLHDLKHVTAPGTSNNSNKAGDPVQATVEEYRKNLEAIVARLKPTGARLIFATTTPVAPETTNPLREPDAPARYNAVALKIMETNGIRVNDLHAFCEPHLQKWQQPKNVHFNREGYEAMAKEIADVIIDALAASPSGNKQANLKTP